MLYRKESTANDDDGIRSCSERIFYITRHVDAESVNNNNNADHVIKHSYDDFTFRILSKLYMHYFYICNSTDFPVIT